jgi:hypothetical protein
MIAAIIVVLFPDCAADSDITIADLDRSIKRKFGSVRRRGVVRRVPSEVIETQGDAVPATAGGP